MSRALAFLYKDYEPRYYLYEICEIGKKLFLVGFAVLIAPGTLSQLMVGFLAALGILLLDAVAAPYRLIEDDYFALGTDFALVALFFFAIVLKVGTLRESVEDRLTDQLKAQFGFNTVVITFGLMASVLSVLTLMSIFAVQQVIIAASKPVLRLSRTQQKPALTLDPRHQWHLFLSHVWGTGQDQCATIKRQLCILLPGVSIFLDVDDLRDIGELETYVDKSAVCMLFVSKGYFVSKNCLREAVCALELEKPLALVHDPVRGGAALDFIMNEECPARLLSPIFDNRSIIMWHRIADFQLVSLKLLAEQMLLGSPEYRREAALELEVPGELSAARLRFPTPVLLYTSPNNAGVLAAARSILKEMPTFRSTSTTPSAIAGLAETMQKEEEANRSAEAAARARKGLHFALPSSGAGFGNKKKEEATHFLLYLNTETFVGEAGEVFAEQVRTARAVNMPILMLHETDPAAGGCEFSKFFQTTPHDLIADGLYGALAMSFLPHPFRTVSVKAAAKSIGAVEASCLSWIGLQSADSSEHTAAGALRASMSRRERRRSMLGRWRSAASRRPGKPSERSLRSTVLGRIFGGHLPPGNASGRSEANGKASVRGVVNRLQALGGKSTQPDGGGGDGSNRAGGGGGDDTHSVETGSFDSSVAAGVGAAFARQIVNELAKGPAGSDDATDSPAESRDSPLDSGEGATPTAEGSSASREPAAPLSSARAALPEAPALPVGRDSAGLAESARGPAGGGDGSGTSRRAGSSGMSRN